MLMMIFGSSDLDKKQKKTKTRGGRRNVEAQWQIGYGVGLRINGPRFESGRGRCVESLDKALYSHCPKEKPSH